MDKQRVVLSFRQKVLVLYFLVCAAAVGFLFPFARQTVKKIAINAMVVRADEFIAQARQAEDELALIKRLKENQALYFFRVSVINPKRQMIYDSHAELPREQTFSVSHPEVAEAFEKGIAYREDYSQLLGQRFFYMGRAFDFHGNTYVMRTAFPWRYVFELMHDYNVGFLTMAIAVLLLFTLMSWAIINRLTRPIEQIIEVIQPYLEGKTANLPEIVLSPPGRTDEFGKLAKTLNSLSERIQSQIASLTHERNEKEAILESLVEGVIAVDDHLIVTYANNMALKLLNAKKSELIHTHFSRAKQERCYALLEECRREQKTVMDDLQLRVDGDKVYLSILASPKKEEKGVILVMQDKSAHYTMLEMSKDFIANASHELKTPITIIRGFAETLHDNPELPPATRGEVTTKIVDNCRRMNALIHNLMTLSNIEHLPRSRLIECDLKEVVERSVQVVQQLFTDATIEVNYRQDGSFVLFADPNLIEMALINLIGNGAKYSGGPAELQVVLERLADSIKVVISDRGIGIPKEDLPHIFRRFYTVDKAHARERGGVGLGLAIVETIVEKHGGKISVESEVGKGTTFTLHLPIKEGS